MKRKEIKERMLKCINATLEERLPDIDSLVEPGDVEAFMWGKDYGEELVEMYIEEFKCEMVTEYLEEIFDSIGTEDLHAPF